MQKAMVSGPCKRTLDAYLIKTGNRIYVLCDNGEWYRYESVNKANDHFAHTPTETFEVSEADDGKLSWRKRTLEDYFKESYVNFMCDEANEFNCADCPESCNGNYRSCGQLGNRTLSFRVIPLTESKGGTI